MRTHRTTGVILSTALVGALAFGTAGTAFASPDVAPTGTSTASSAPAAPDPAALLAQVTSLGQIGAVLTPVTDAVKAVLAAPGNKLTPEEATKHADAVKAAIDAANAPAAPAAPAAPGLPLPVPVPVPPLPVPLPLHGAAHRAAPAAADLAGDALAGLQAAVGDLLKAATAGDPTAAVGAVLKVVTGLVNFLVAKVLGGGLPIPDLKGLPKLPALPALPVPLPPLPVPLPLG